MGKLDFIKKGAKKLFGIRPRVETYITKAPSDDIARIQKIAGKIVSENNQLKVDNLKKDAQIKGLLRRFKEENEEILIAGDIKAQQKNYKELEKQRSLILSFKGFSDYPSLFTKTNRSFGRFCGFLMKETEEGYTIFYPLLQRGRKVVKLNVYSANPLEFFRSTQGLVSQIKNGKIDTNIDLTADGRKLAIIKDIDVLKKIVDEKLGDSKMKVINMGISEVEKKGFEQIIASQEEENKQLWSRVSDLEDLRVQYESRINELDAKAGYSGKERDIVVASNQHLLDKSQKLVVESTKAVSAVQDAKIEQVLTERQNMAFTGAFNEMVEKMGKKIPESVRETAKREAEEDLMRNMEILKKAEQPAKLVVTREKKGGEEAPEQPAK